jgi:hypothetical protein
LGRLAEALFSTLVRAIRYNLFCLKGRQKRISTSIPPLFSIISFIIFYCAIDCVIEKLLTSSNLKLIAARQFLQRQLEYVAEICFMATSDN